MQTKNMRILTNNSLRRAGGINRRLKEMKRQVHHYPDVHLSIVYLSPQEKHRTDGRIEQHGLVPPDFNFEEPYSGLSTTREMEERYQRLSEMFDPLIEKTQPDVVLLMSSFFIPFALLLSAKRHGIPIVHLYVGSAVTEFNPPRVGKLATAYWPLEKMFLQSVDHTIFNSQHTVRAIQDLFGELPPQYSVVWNGIPESMFIGEPAEDRSGVGYVARYTEFKNPHFLLPLSGYLRQRGEEAPFHIVSNITPSAKHYHPWKEAGFEIREQEGHDGRLREFYQSRTALICPSHFETFGNVPLEGIAAGIPCVTSAGMGAAEVFAYLGLDHLVVDTTKVEPAGQLLVDLLRTRPVIGTEIRRELKQMCNWEYAIDAYFSCLQQIAKK